MGKRPEKSTRPRIGVLIASLGGGGAERMAMRLVEHLPAQGYETRLLALDINQDYTGNGTVGPGRAPVHLSGSRVDWPTMAKVAMVPWQWMQLNRHLKQMRLDLLISFMERANIINLAQQAIPRRIISIRNCFSMMMAAKSPLKRMLVAKAYGKLLPAARKIVFNSVASKCDFERFYHPGVSGTCVAYNFCHPQQIREQAAKRLADHLAPPAHGALVVSCGRLKRQKGHWHLLRAFSMVARQHPDAHLVICGKGPLRSELMALGRRLRILDKVTLTGFLPNPLPLMARADFLVLPSLWEGFPNVLLEAMTLGTPVVAADCMTGPRELMVPAGDPMSRTKRLKPTPYGILTPPLDGQYRWQETALSAAEAALARAMGLMLEEKDYRRRCAAAAKQRARDFTPARSLQQWQAAIEEVLNGAA